MNIIFDKCNLVKKKFVIKKMWNTIIFSLIYYRCCKDVNVYANKS